MKRENLFKAIVSITVASAFIMPGVAVFANIGTNMGYTENNDMEIVGVDWWPMFHHDRGHSGYSSSMAPDARNLIWNYTTGGTVDSSPAVVDGKVYVGSWDNNVYCLNASDGKVIWSYPTDYMVSSSPAVVDGKIYIGSYDDNVYCLNAQNGSLIWKYTTGGNVESSPAVVDGKVYVGSWDNNVYCLNASDGLLIWSYPTNDWVQSSSPAVVDGKVYIGSSDDNVYCLNASDGLLIWKYDTHGGWVFSSPAVADDRVYVGSGYNDKKIYCLNASDGSVVWEYATGSSVSSSPVIFDGKIYIGSFDYNVYCLNASDGLFIWKYVTGGRVSSSPAVADGKVYVGGNDDQTVYCLNAQNGSLIWKYVTGSCVRSSPAIADGKVYIGSVDKKVYCFGPLDHDVGVGEITEPSWPSDTWPPGMYPVEAVVKNYGSCNESNFNVNASIWLTSPTKDELFYHDDVLVDTSMNFSDELVVRFDNVTFLDTDEGNYRLEVATELAGDENPGNDHKVLFFTIERDAEPPVTMHGFDGVMGDNGWYISCVTITLSATDEGSGVAATYYCLDGGDWMVYTGSFEVCEDGVHNLSYYSVDYAGNEETVKSVNFKVDQTAPTIVLTVENTGLMKWLLTATVSDETSGIARVEFYLNGELLGNVIESPYTWEVSEKGTAYAVVYDNAGNEASDEVPVSYSQNQIQSSSNLIPVQRRISLILGGLTGIQNIQRRV